MTKIMLLGMIGGLIGLTIGVVIVATGIAVWLLRKPMLMTVRRTIEYLKMKKAMKMLESRWYYTSDIARKDMMWFNRSFWGGYKFINPKLNWNDYTKGYYISF